MYDFKKFSEDDCLLIKKFYNKKEIIKEINQIGSFEYKENFNLYESYNTKHLHKQKYSYASLNSDLMNEDFLNAGYHFDDTTNIYRSNCL